MLTKCLGREN